METVDLRHQSDGRDSAKANDDSLSTSESRLAPTIPFILRPAVPMSVEGIQVGQLVDRRFEVIERIGHGGMGEVFKIRDTYHRGTIRALKTIRTELSIDPEFVERFNSEVALALTITHPNVCRVYDFGIDKGSGGERLFYTMEFLNGKTLSARLGCEGPLPVAQMERFALGLLAGLEAAHSKDIVHRDLKPSNIMLVEDADSRPVILDFGLAINRVMGGAHHTQEGTLQYMAPEQRSGGPITRATDIFALGLIFHEALVGHRPATLATLNEGLQVFDEPSGRTLDKSKVPRQWARLILRCIQHAASDRYQSVSCIRTEIENWHGRSRRRLLVLGAIATVSSVGTAMRLQGWLSNGRWLGPVQSSSAASLAILPFKIGSADLQYLAEGISDRLSDILTQLPGVRVLARSAVQRFTDTEKDPLEVGKRFRVRYLIMGTVQNQGSGLHVTNEIVDASTGLQVWAGTEDLSREEVERLSLTLSRIVTYALHIDRQPAERSDRDRPLTKDPEAYTSYLLGRFYAKRRSSDALRESIEHLKLAVQRDPQFAAAWAALGYSWYDLSIREDVDWENQVQQSMMAARRALRLDQRLWEGYLVIGCIKRNWEWDFPGSRQNLARACELNPGSPVAHRWYANLMSLLGHHSDAISDIEQAVSLDPLSSDLLVSRATILLYAGRADEALTEYEAVVHSDSTLR